MVARQNARPTFISRADGLGQVGGEDLDQTTGRGPGSASSGRLPLVVASVVAAALALLVVLAVRHGGPAGADARRDASLEERLGLAGTVLAEPWERPDFTLTTTEGEPFHFAEETAGQLTLLFFGYTSCPDVCPVHLGTLAGALQRPDMPKAQVVFVSVDPERDTPEVVREYLDRFDEGFIGLVGTAEELAAAQEATGVPVAVNQPLDDGGYLVGHASQIVAYTSDDLAHVVYPFGVRRQDWVQDLPRLNRIDWAAVDADRQAREAT